MALEIKEQELKFGNEAAWLPVNLELQILVPILGDRIELEAILTF